MAKSKPRVIKSYEKLDEKLREEIAERYMAAMLLKSGLSTSEEDAS